MTGTGEVSSNGGRRDIEEVSDLSGVEVLPVGEVDDSALLHTEIGDRTPQVDIGRCRFWNRGPLIGGRAQVAGLLPLPGTVLISGDARDRPHQVGQRVVHVMTAVKATSDPVERDGHDVVRVMRTDENRREPRQLCDMLTPQLLMAGFAFVAQGSVGVHSADP